MDRRGFLVAAAAVPLALRSPESFARARGGTPVALVTADTEASVVAVHLTSGRIVGRLATLPRPRSIESVLGATAVIAHSEDGAVTIVDGEQLRVRRVLRAFAEPRYTAASPDGRHAYVTDSARAELVTLDLARARVVHRTELGGPARHLGIDAAGRTLWVALGNKAPALAVLSLADRARPRLVARIRPPFLAHDVAFAPDGRVWVSSGDRGAIALYDARTRRVRTTLPADRPPQHIAFAGRAAHVTSGDEGTLGVHGLDGSPRRTTRIPVGSYNVQEGWGVVLTPSLSRGTLCLLSRAGVHMRTVGVAPATHDACFVMTA
jgi:DNA-binding beta-propeller fold protein YncE